jgi:hypothetical protein
MWQQECGSKYAFHGARQCLRRIIRRGKANVRAISPLALKATLERIFPGARTPSIRRPRDGFIGRQVRAFTLQYFSFAAELVRPFVSIILL